MPLKPITEAIKVIKEHAKGMTERCLDSRFGDCCYLNEEGSACFIGALMLGNISEHKQKGLAGSVYGTGVQGAIIASGYSCETSEMIIYQKIQNIHDDDRNDPKEWVKRIEAIEESVIRNISMEFTS